MNALQVAQATPYGHPMLLVDAVEEGEEPGTAIAFKNITFSEHCYRSAQGAGCLPHLEYPVSLMIESFSQGAGLLLTRRGFLAGGRPDAVLSVQPTQPAQPTHPVDWAIVFGEFRDIEIVGEAYPGERLCHRVRIEEIHGRLVLLSGRIQVGEREILRIGRLTALRAAFTPNSLRRVHWHPAVTLAAAGARDP